MELDFTAEGHNAEKCATHLAQLGYVYVPKVFWEQTSKVHLTFLFLNSILQMSLAHWRTILENSDYGVY